MFAEDPGEIISALLKVAAQLRARFAEFLERFEMTEGRYAVLSALDHAGTIGLSQAAVAEQLMHSESNISSLIERLDQDGLVSRRWSDTDRRKRVLLLTPAGRILTEQIETARRRWAERLLIEISALERRQLAKLLWQLADRREVDSNQRPPRGSKNSLNSKANENSTWEPVTLAVAAERASPQTALERMLSSLGVANRFAEDEE
jgi:DNA-binding MarR family transcriptional regulator